MVDEYIFESYDEEIAFYEEHPIDSFNFYLTDENRLELEELFVCNSAKVEQWQSSVDCGALLRR